MRSVAVDEYVLDTLMRDLVGHDRQPSAFLVYLHLWQRSASSGEAPVVATLAQIAEATGLSKRAVQDALSRLHRRKLIGITRTGITAVPEYTVKRPWRR
jgi:transcription initiation factor IIE alpha subunit